MRVYGVGFVVELEGLVGAEDEIGEAFALGEGNVWDAVAAYGVIALEA